MFLKLVCDTAGRTERYAAVCGKLDTLVYQCYVNFLFYLLPNDTQLFIRLTLSGQITFVLQWTFGVMFKTVFTRQLYTALRPLEVIGFSYRPWMDRN